MGYNNLPASLHGRGFVGLIIMYTLYYTYCYTLPCVNEMRPQHNTGD